MIVNRKLWIGLLLVCGFSILAFISVHHISKWWSERRMIEMLYMEHGDEVAFDSSADTVDTIKRVIPKLIASHRQGIGESPANIEENPLANMEVYNNRISSWNALHTAVSVSRDSVGIKYIQEFVTDEAALSEEVRSGRQLLDSIGDGLP